MHTTLDLIELAKQRLALRHGLPLPMTDYRLGKLMNIKQGTLSAWRTGVRHIGTEFAERFADACELPAEYVYACVQAERADPAERPILESIAAAFRGNVAAIAAAGMVFACSIFPAQNARAGVALDASGYTLCEVSKRRRRERLRRWFMTLFPIATLALSGCATMRDPVELAWQAAHVVDTLQTRSAVNDPCFQEGESAWLIGDRPSDATLAAWSIGTAVAHAGVTHWLRETDHPKLARAWQFVSLAHVGYNVGKNYSIGVRIGGSNKVSHDCYPVAP